MLIDLVGNKYGKLEVLELNHIKRRSFWLCICECGNKCVRSRDALKNNRTISSCGCINSENVRNARLKENKRAFKHHCWRGCGDLSAAIWSKIRENAKSRKISLDIDINYAWELYISQNKLCALTGLPIEISRINPDDKKTYGTASLDRKDSKSSYTKENVWWVHKIINKMKHINTVQDFIDLCGIVYLYSFDKNYVCESNLLYSGNIVQNYNNRKGFKAISGQRWADIIKHAKSRNIEFDITIEEAWNIFEEQNKLCGLTGVSLFFSSTTSSFDGTASFDRISSSKGYTTDNVWWIHKKLNIMKNDLWLKDFVDYCKLVYIHNKNSNFILS